MSLKCPLCDNIDLRYARIRSLSERLMTLAGIHPLRCRECRYRFVARTWSISGMLWARCPRCWRTDLAKWSEEDYRAPALQNLRIALGAHRFRCEYCRVNFTSFRPRMQRYVRQAKAARAARKSYLVAK
ncbi:MAG TPA: hypothetical protein VN428_12140 [Bryobacteraceae bacterium]|nr:hypothetical protein [Bryobacteraceae bacterium]